MEYNILGPFLVILVSTQHVFSQSDLNSSLTFVIDDTYSMKNDIAQVKLKVKSIVDTVMNSKESPIKHFVLVTFNDPDVKLVTATMYKKKFIELLKSIKVQRPSSNDCPEYSLTGIEKAIEESRPGSYIYVFTDASSKDYAKYEAVKLNALEKGVQIVFFLTGYCKPTEGRSDVYYHLAEDTKGQVFDLHKDELGNVLNYVKEQVKSRKIVIASHFFRSGVHLFDFTVDGNMKEVVVSVEGVNSGVRIRDQQDKDVKTENLVNTSWITIVKVAATQTGVYHANVKSDSDSTVEVSATNTLHFQTGFSRFIPKTIKETGSRPLPDIPSFVLIKLNVEVGVFALNTVKILDLTRNIIEEIDVVPLHTNQLLYATSRKFTPPNDSFRIAITGFDAKSQKNITRYSPVPIEPKGLVKIKVPDTINNPKKTTKKVTVGSDVTLECQSHGYPEPDIKWIFYSTYDRSKPYEILRNERQGTLKLPKIQATQQGYYVCEANSVQGKSNVTYNITVLSQPEEGGKTNVLYDTDCKLNIKTEFLGNPPLMSSSPDFKHSSFKNINGILSIPANKRILLGCPKGFMKFPNTKKMYVICNRGTSFIMKNNGASYDFSDLKCKEEIQTQIIRTGKTCKNYFTELLKVGYDLREQFLEVYEVCFDTKHRVSLFAKQEIHKPMTGIKINKPKWYENEYMPFDFDQMYNTSHIYRINDELNKKTLPDDCSFSKRQLVDPRNVLLGLPQAATYNYLNVVPHWSTCNEENWDLVETKIRSLAETRPLQVWTGVSSKQLQLKDVWSDPVDVFLIDENKHKQPIPRYLWKVVLDSSTMESLAIIQLNVPDLTLLDSNVEKYVRCPDICSQIKWMNDPDNTWQRKDKGYTFCCNVKDFAVWFGYDSELFNSSGKLLDVAEPII